MSQPRPSKKRRPFGGTPLFYNKEAKMARTLTLSALYLMALGTMFCAYALSL